MNEKNLKVSQHKGHRESGACTKQNFESVSNNPSNNCLHSSGEDSLSGKHFSNFATKTHIHYCGYSLEAPCQGAFNKFPQYMLLWKNKKKSITFLKEMSYL